MRLGILALVLIFFASGFRYIRESGYFPRQQASETPEAGQAVYNRRKLAFGGLMLAVGALVLIYYFVTI